MKHLVFSLLLGSVFLTTALGISHSMSCTMVNGVQRCEESHDETGNYAGSAAIAKTDGRDSSTYQGAGTGSTDRGTSNVEQSGTGEYADYGSPSYSRPRYASPVFPPAGFGGFPGFGVFPGFGGGAYAGFPRTGAYAGPGFARTGAYAGPGFAGTGAFAGAGFPFGTGASAYAGRRRR